MGEGRWGNYKGLFNIYDKIIKRIDPTKVILYGKDLRKELKDDNRIIYKQYNNTGE